MTRTTSITVPATIRGQTLLVTYRVTVVVNTEQHGAKRDSPVSAWGYATAAPVRVSSEPELDVVISPAGDGGQKQ